jgi:RimJ/RimL family protein N-acetyltransferase
LIRTPRLLLRPYAVDDFEPYAAIVCSSAGLSREDAWNRLLRYIGHWSSFHYGLFAILDGGRLVGETGFARFGRGLGEAFDASPEASWTIAAERRHQGLAYEASLHAHGWFESNHPRQRTVCLVEPGNAASISLAGKLGYRPFATAHYRDRPFVQMERTVQA